MAETATVQIAMPEMGESVTEGIVLEWHVAEGDFVSEGDTVVEVSTDKVDAEVPAPMDGVITKLVAAVDDEVPVGAPLAEMEAGDGTTEGSSRWCRGRPGAGACGRGRGFVLGTYPWPPEYRRREWLVRVGAVAATRRRRARDPGGSQGCGGDRGRSQLRQRFGTGRQGD